MIFFDRSVPLRLYSVPCSALLYLLIFPFEEAYLAALMLTLVALLVNFKTVRLLDHDAWWPMILSLLLVVPLVVTSTVAHDWEMTLNDALRAFFFGLLSVVVVAWFAHANSSPYRWLWVFGIVLLVWIFDALLQYLSGANVLGFPMRGSRVTGIFYPSIAVGTVVAHCAPILLEGIRRQSKRGGYWNLLWLLIVPMVGVIVLGGSRSSWIDFILVLGLYGLFLMVRGYVSWKSVGALIALAAIAVAGFYLISPEFQIRVARTVLLFSGEYDLMNRATSNRFPIWQSAWQAFTDYPMLGFGSEAFQDYVRENELPSSPVKYAHFFLLDVLMMTGLLGLLGYVVFYGLLMRHGWQALARGHDFAAVLFICALVMAFPANTHWGFYHYRPAGLMWLFIILAYAFRYYENRFTVVAVEQSASGTESVEDIPHKTSHAS